MTTRVTHIATRGRRAGVALFHWQLALTDGPSYAEQIEQLRREATLQITKETLERPSVLLVGIEGSKT